MTFSIAARCADTGQFGVAVSSSSPAVAARCAYVRAGAGAAASQNITDPRLGVLLLEQLEAGKPAVEAMRNVIEQSASIEFRQLAVVDAEGSTAAYSGELCLGTHATYAGTDAVAAGNLLTTDAIPRLMVEAFQALDGKHLGDRLTGALTAALEAGGEEGPVHSAGLVIVDAMPWPTTDLRVDWSDDPIGELTSLWRLWRPQIDAYIQRALDPGLSPSYGVPGDTR
jgi:uncharacterized Ntn-hydrolase superfamily protein